jgi:NitT/TauT family transport system substrate-binding protein
MVYWNVPQQTIVVIISLSLLLSSDGRSLAQDSLQKVTIGYPAGGITHIDLFIARERKFFRAESLEPFLVQVRGSLAVSATVAGDLDAISSLGSGIRAIQRGAPLRALAVSLSRPLFWLVARPEYQSIKDLKGKILGVNSIGGAQHVTAKRLFTMAALDLERDVTTIHIGEESVQLQALAKNLVQVVVLTPPNVQIARDKFKMSVLGSAADKFPSLQSGTVVHMRALQQKPELVKKILRARAKAIRYFHENDDETSEMLAKSWKTDVATAREAYVASKASFSRTGIPTEKEIMEYLAMDAQVLELPDPVPAAKIFDFTLQGDVNREIGMR